MQHSSNLSAACKLALKFVSHSFFASRFGGLLHYHVSDDNFVIQRDFLFSLCNKLSALLLDKVVLMILSCGCTFVLYSLTLSSFFILFFLLEEG